MMYGLDLFSGIGGITKALEGYVEPVAYCENDRYAQGVLLSRMSDGSLPYAPIWDDVRTLRGSMLPPVDIIYGGFPCQDISVAGRGAGLAGERSGLFFEIARLIGEIRPRFVFLENVPKITNRGLGTVIEEFARLRYDCRWGIVSAYAVGANHLRRRWWLLAYSHSERLEGSGKSGDANKKQRKKGNSNEAAISFRRNIREVPYDQIMGMDARIHFWMERVKSLGNSVVPAQAREAFERLMGLK